jgi:hypothetical protein
VNVSWKEERSHFACAIILSFVSAHVFWRDDIFLLSLRCFVIMSDEHSDSVCPARVIDMCFDSVNVLLGITVLHISMNVG